MVHVFVHDSLTTNSIKSPEICIYYDLGKHLAVSPSLKVYFFADLSWIKMMKYVIVQLSTVLYWNRDKRLWILLISWMVSYWDTQYSVLEHLNLLQNYRIRIVYSCSNMHLTGSCWTINRWQYKYYLTYLSAKMLIVQYPIQWTS